MYLDLEGKTLAELREEAKKLGIKRVTGVKKDELVKCIKSGGKGSGKRS